MFLWTKSSIYLNRKLKKIHQVFTGDAIQLPESSTYYSELHVQAFLGYLFVYYVFLIQ